MDERETRRALRENVETRGRERQVARSDERVAAGARRRYVDECGSEFRLGTPRRRIGIDGLIRGDVRVVRRRKARATNDSLARAARAMGHRGGRQVGRRSGLDARA